MSKVSNRSYEDEAMGGRYRRNRKYLISLNTPESTNGLPDDDNDIPDITKDMPDTTRSGRQSKPPDSTCEYKLTLYLMTYKGRCNVT